MPEIADFALILLTTSGGFVLAILSTRLSRRLPIPAPGIFLLAATGATHFWPRLGNALAIETVERIALVALVMILLNDGMEIRWRRISGAAGPMLALGVPGTFATAALVALGAHVLLGFSWTLSGLVGAALAPTDPAVMFSVLDGNAIGSRPTTILEGEAGVNDPAGIALMLGMVGLGTHDGTSLGTVVADFSVQMVIGLALGFAASRLLPAAGRVRTYGPCCS